MKERFKRMLASLFERFDSIYWCTVPFATLIIRRKLAKQVDEVYIAMQQAVELDDDVFKILDKLRFKEDDEHKSFVSVIARGKIAPNVTDAESVKLDAVVWFQDETRELDKLFLAYELAGEIECYPSYVPAKDIVVFTMHPVAQNDLDSSQTFLHINYVVTALSIACVAFATAFAVSLFF